MSRFCLDRKVLDMFFINIKIQKCARKLWELICFHSIAYSIFYSSKNVTYRQPCDVYAGDRLIPQPHTSQRAPRRVLVRICDPHGVQHILQHITRASELHLALQLAGHKLEGTFIWVGDDYRWALLHG